MPVTVRQYDDFDLQLRPFQDGDFEAAVLRSPAGEARQLFALQHSPAEMATLLPDVEAAIAGGDDTSVAQAIRFGAMLFTVLFTGRLQQLYDQSLSHAQSRGRDLRIRLRVLDDPLLAALPWELLYDTREQRFIALQPDVVLTRTAEAQQPVRDLAVAPPLRVLAMAAQPSDMAALDLERERSQLERSLARLGAGVELRWVDGQNRRALHDALQQADWHVFHFLGHGLFDRTTGSGALAFAGDDGLAELHTAEELSRLLGDHDALRLVVLNACEGAQGGGSQMDAGIAQQVVRAGVPAVVAMQAPIRDTHAAELTASFYGALGNGLAIDAAFAEARKALSLAAPGALAWAVPVLVMRSGDSRFAVQDKRLQWDGRNPYRGLETFQEADAEFFFGRERLVDELVDRLADARFVCVAGPSGSGKSSLVQAGLLYALKQGRIAKSEHWLYATASPSTAPLDELARAVARAGKTPTAAEYIRKNAVQDGTALCTQVETLLTHDRQQRFVLYVDQFEELFTQTSAESERIAFLAQLTTAAEKIDCRTIVIVSIRSDFLSQCSAYPALRELINRQFFLVGEMQPEELEQAIVQPARAVGAGVEPELIDKITAEMDGEPGALPLMEFALRDLFESETAKKQAGDAVTLTLDAYLRRGGIRKALRRHADRVFKTLTPDQQALARSIFTFLVEVGVGAQPTRRTATVEALQHLGQPQAVDAVLQALADARLLTTSSPANGEAGMVTVAHERLLSSWPWLEKLIDENREAIYLQSVLTRDATEWDRNDRDASFLYAGTRLAVVREKLVGSGLRLPELAAQFVQIAIAADDKRQAKEQLIVRRKLRRRNWLIGVLSLVLTIALLFVGRSVYMSWLQSTSPWQPVESFPKDFVYSVAYHSGDSPEESFYCVGTINLGIGCNYDGKGWNLYQSFPTGLSLDGGVGAFSGNVHGITGLGIDVGNPNIILAYSMSGAVYRSTNRGLTWEPTVGSIPANSVARISVNGNYAAAVTWHATTDEEHTLNYSTDGGEHWMEIEQTGLHTLGDVNDVLINKRREHIFVATDQGVFRSPLTEDLSWSLFLPDVHASILLENADGCCLLVIGRSQNDSSWTVISISQSGRLRSVYALPKKPLYATLDSLNSETNRMFILVEQGHVVVMDDSGIEMELNPGFVGNSAFSIVAVPDNGTGKTKLLMANYDGLYEYHTTFE